MSIFTYGFRINKIFKNQNATAYFTPSEIVRAIVNLLDAKKSLSSYEFYFVSAVFDTYRRIKRKSLLSKKGFVELSKEIIAHFDLIAPYYKFCGDKNMRFMMLEEDDKHIFRQRAREILNKNAIFGNEWMMLHTDFLQIFYMQS